MKGRISWQYRKASGGLQNPGHLHDVPTTFFAFFGKNEMKENEKDVERTNLVLKDYLASTTSVSFHFDGHRRNRIKEKERDETTLISVTYSSTLTLSHHGEVLNFCGSLCMGILIARYRRVAFSHSLKEKKL